jgi:hypothetical protein
LCRFLEQTRKVEEESHVAAAGRDAIPPRLAGWRKDFKFSGQIGEGPNALPYMSFLRQIQSGQEKRFKDREILWMQSSGLYSPVHAFEATLREGRTSLWL